MAEPQFRAGRGHDRRDVDHARRLDRHDGRGRPARSGFIGAFLDTALAQRADLVYSKPTNTRPHGFLRNLTSRGARVVLATVFEVPGLHPIRKFPADPRRSLAVSWLASPHSGLYLDIALTWVVERSRRRR